VFDKIRFRLLISYAIVLASVLGIFAVAVHFFFIRSLQQQLIDSLTILAQSAATNAEYDNGELKIESDFSAQNLLVNHRALQWFTTEGYSIAQQGKDIIDLPFYKDEKLQTQSNKKRIVAVTIPIIDSDSKQLIGYIRASQSLVEFDETIEHLNWGLGSGILVALILSSLGGIWLTRQAMKPVEESFARLKQFTADASHELRSPLMAIKTNTAVALKYAEGMRETDREKFAAIASAGKQMISLTEDLLFLARNDRMRDRSWQQTNLREIIDNLVRLYQPQASAKQIIIQAYLSDNLAIVGDGIQLTKLFSNLLINAIYYTPKGGAIEIENKDLASQINVRIKDTGIGIAPEEIEQIFERFWRSDKSRSYHSGGSGLGLSIAQIIAKNHGGIITVSSQLGIGSCFTVCLPIHLSYKS
jgi:two-component system, OmpR family, manganese sensing sensor histidine kinase